MVSQHSVTMTGHLQDFVDILPKLYGPVVALRETDALQRGQVLGIWTMGTEYAQSTINLV